MDWNWWGDGWWNADWPQGPHGAGGGGKGGGGQGGGGGGGGGSGSGGGGDGSGVPGGGNRPTPAAPKVHDYRPASQARQNRYLVRANDRLTEHVEMVQAQKEQLRLEIVDLRRQLTDLVAKKAEEAAGHEQQDKLAAVAKQKEELMAHIHSQDASFSSHTANMQAKHAKEKADMKTQHASALNEMKELHKLELAQAEKRWREWATIQKNQMEKGEGANPGLLRCPAKGLAVFMSFHGKAILPRAEAPLLVLRSQASIRGPGNTSAESSSVGKEILLQCTQHLGRNLGWKGVEPRCVLSGSRLLRCLRRKRSRGKGRLALAQQQPQCSLSNSGILRK